MKNFILTMAITVCVCIGIFQLISRAFQPIPHHSFALQQEPWQRPSIESSRTFAPQTAIRFTPRQSISSQPNYRSVAQNPSATATSGVKFHFLKNAQSASFGNYGAIGGSTASASHGKKSSRTASSGGIHAASASIGGFSGLSLIKTSKTETAATESKEQDNGLLAMAAPFSPMMAPPTVGGDYGGETPDIGVEDATDDTGVGIETGVPLRDELLCLLILCGIYTVCKRRRLVKKNSLKTTQK